MKKTINFTLTKSNHILINCTVNGIDGVFIIDSGATNSCINYYLSSKFKLSIDKSPLKASSATNEINETYISKNNYLEIGKLSKKKFDIFLFDMTFINNSLKEKGVSEVDGIIGGDILNELNVCINYKKKEISLEF